MSGKSKRRTRSIRDYCLEKARLETGSQTASRRQYNWWDLTQQYIPLTPLRAGGATDLLCAGIPREIIQKAGRWNSDEVLKYLRDECFIADTCAKAFAKL